MLIMSFRPFAERGSGSGNRELCVGGGAADPSEANKGAAASLPIADVMVVPSLARRAARGRRLGARGLCDRLPRVPRWHPGAFPALARRALGQARTGALDSPSPTLWRRAPARGHSGPALRGRRRARAIRARREVRRASALERRGSRARYDAVYTA